MEHLTVSYKHISDGSPVYMDLFIPQSTAPGQPLKHPLVLYFHGGGFAVGDRSSWMPVWLRGKFASRSIKLNGDRMLTYAPHR